MSNQDIEQVVIIGGGPAGLAAALYTARAGLKPLVFAGSPPGGQLTLTTEVENFPGVPNIQGPELIAGMREQVLAFETRIKDQNIGSLDFSTYPFKVTASQKNSEPIITKSIIIATGAKAIWLDIPSETRLRGKGVSACATCDGFFFKNKVVAVVGGGDTAMEEALTLTHFVSKVILIHRKNTFRASQIMQDRVKNHPSIEIIYSSEITEVLGEDKVSGLKIKDTSTQSEREISVQGLFIAIGHKPDTAFLPPEIEKDSAGYIRTFAAKAEDYLKGTLELSPEELIALRNEDRYYSTATSVAGVFAGGDCVDHTYRQASTASGMGVMASIDVERWLQGR